MKKEERKKVGRVGKTKWKKEETREDTRYGENGKCSRNTEERGMERRRGERE